MASLGKSKGKASRKELRSRTPTEKELQGGALLCRVSEGQSQIPSLKAEDIQALAVRLEELHKTPKTIPKASLMTRVLVRRPHPPETGRRTVRITVARPAPQGSSMLPLDSTEAGGPRFDARGMVLPHSILGTLENFKQDMEARGELELVKRVPVSVGVCPLLEVMQKGSPVKQHCPLDPQSQALHHWEHHMVERRRQQAFLSRLLHKPVQTLLMTQSDWFREIQERRELISRGLPALCAGQVPDLDCPLLSLTAATYWTIAFSQCVLPRGYHVGSEFWNLPQNIGDEFSGITSTLTRRERGYPEPITRIGQPRRIRLETGNAFPEDSPSACRTWAHSLYLQHRWQELGELLMDLGFTQPEIDGLEVIGRNQVFSADTAECCSLLDEDNREPVEEEKETVKKESSAELKNPPVDDDDITPDTALVPVLHFCGHHVCWTGSSPLHQGVVGVTGQLSFEAPIGQKASSYLELHNEGSTAIYYYWRRQTLRHSFREAGGHGYRETGGHGYRETGGHGHGQRFYFNSSTGIILPGEMQQILFTFKSTTAGIFRELWCLNTHPVLLSGALLQVSLSGVALHWDESVQQRATLERGLLQKEAASVCRQLLSELLQGVHSPERPDSPAEHRLTEEGCFCKANPQLHYQQGAVQELRELWEQVAPQGGDPHHRAPAWDFSVPSLRRTLLAMPEGEREGSVQRHKENALACFNTLVLELQQFHERPLVLSPYTIGLQLWRELLDKMVSEALWQRHLLELPDRDAWADSRLDQAGFKVKKEDNSEKKGGISIEEEEKKGAMKQPGNDSATEEQLCNKRKGRDEKHHRMLSGGRGLKCDLVESQEELQEQYRRKLYQQTYLLLEELVDSLCELLDEAQSY
ncbi:MYCBP-associated protein isoform X2 [Brienomyrus brachyistius]|uniref:MYCBP-associated protein isoform X2 n=1 Tax=Brienomyrus brachyistius TaxID=42636 RepID=UPI0020B3AB34|nr:MYCBP-associated protein isoform X2 [Brienomyrus brachyistius]